MLDTVEVPDTELVLVIVDNLIELGIVDKDLSDNRVSIFLKYDHKAVIVGNQCILESIRVSLEAAQEIILQTSTVDFENLKCVVWMRFDGLQVSTADWGW